MVEGWVLKFFMFIRHFFMVVLATVFSLSIGSQSQALELGTARGDSTYAGMAIKAASAFNGQFRVLTTGTAFEFQNNILKISQGLDKKRELAFLQLPTQEKFSIVESHADHVVLHGKVVDLTIYGDSTCIFMPLQRTSLTINGRFKPQYVGRYLGELLLIDDIGGMEMSTTNNSESTDIHFIDQNSKSWKAIYRLGSGERLMISAFPGKPFDWDKSFNSNIVFTQAAYGRKYGLMPPNWLFIKWSQYFNVVILWHVGLYRPVKGQAAYAGPYEIANPYELNRAVEIAHRVGLKVALYTSYYYFMQKHQDDEAYFNQIRNLMECFKIDGVYIDGLLSETSGHKNGQLFSNWEMIRRLRQLFGSEGVLVYHGTAFGHQVASMPNVDVYCDATLNGENVPFNTFDDPYVQYHVRKYGISNTVALWKPGPHPKVITDREIIDTVLNMNGRLRYWAGVTAVEPTQNNQNIWVSDIDQNYRYYLEKLLFLKRSRAYSPVRPLD